MCNKQKHVHEIDAKGQARSLVMSPNFVGGEVRVYKCPCGFYHVSVSPVRYKIALVK